MEAERSAALLALANRLEMKRQAEIEMMAAAMVDDLLADTPPSPLDQLILVLAY